MSPAQNVRYRGNRTATIPTGRQRHEKGRARSVKCQRPTNAEHNLRKPRIHKFYDFLKSRRSGVESPMHPAAKNSLNKSLKKSLNNTILVKGNEISHEWFWVLFECPLTRFSSPHLPVFPSHHSFSLPFLLALQCHHIMNKYTLRCTILSAVLLLFYHDLFLLLWYTSWNENKTDGNGKWKLL